MAPNGRKLAALPCAVVFTAVLAAAAGCGGHPWPAPEAPEPVAPAPGSTEAEAPAGYRYLPPVYSGTCRPVATWGLGGKRARVPRYGP